MADQEGQKDMGTLCLTRKPGESIVIGGDIRVEVIDVVKGRNVRLRITAPKSVKVMRDDLLEKIRKGEAEQK